MKLHDIELPGPKRDFVGYGRHVPKVKWPNDARVCVSICLNYEEGSEHSKPAGDDRNEGQAEVAYVMDPKYRDFAAESVKSRSGKSAVELSCPA